MGHRSVPRSRVRSEVRSLASREINPAAKHSAPRAPGCVKRSSGSRKLVLAVIRATNRWRAVVICKDMVARQYLLIFMSRGAARFTAARKAEAHRYEEVVRVGCDEVSRVRRGCPEEAARRADFPDSADATSNTTDGVAFVHGGGALVPLGLAGREAAAARYDQGRDPISSRLVRASAAVNRAPPPAPEARWWAASGAIATDVRTKISRRNRQHPRECIACQCP